MPAPPFHSPSPANDHERAVVPAAARALLARFDERATHYEVRDDRPAG